MANQITTYRPEETKKGPSSDNNSITFEGLDPILGSLGIMIGLLKLKNAETNEYGLLNSWFADPYNNTKNGISNNPQQFGELLGQILGQLGGNAIGVPEKNPAILGVWYPIKFKTQGEYKPTGLYIVSRENNGTTAIGLGVLKKWDAFEDIQAEIWASIPFIAITPGAGAGQKGSFELTFMDSSGDYPITFGAAVEGKPDKPPIIDINGIQFNGVKVSTNISPAAPNPFDVVIEVLGLQLEGDDKPKNYSLANLEDISAQELLDTAINLFLGALSERFPDEHDQILSLAPIFGLSSKPIVGLTPEVTLPTLEWAKLLEQAKEGQIAVPFFNWFNQLASTPELLKGWLFSLGKFLNTQGANLSITGAGLRSNPYQIPILSVSSVGTLNFTIASVVANNGERFLYPGLSFVSSSLSLGSNVEFVMEADLELAKFRLAAASAAIDFDLNFKTNFSLQGTNNNPLLPKTNGYSVGSFAGGLSVGVADGKIIPYLELLNVILPEQASLARGEQEDPPNVFSVVNLLSPKELAKLGATALSATLQQFMGLNGDNPSSFIQGLAALIGLVKPATATTAYTFDPPFSETAIEASIKDPIKAWSNYFLKVLNVPAQAGHNRPFTFLLQSFASILQLGNVEVVVDGNGSQSNPWRAGISLSSDETLPAYLTAYENTTENGTELVFGLAFEPVFSFGTGDDAIEIVPSLLLDAVHISFPKEKAVTVNWINSIAAQLTLPKGAKTPPIGNTYFSVDMAQLSVGWWRQKSWDWSMQVIKPSLTIGESTITGASLNFADNGSATWKNLVDSGAATFAPFFEGVLGIGLMKTNTRPGALLTGTLGLLPDLSQFEFFKNNGLSGTDFHQLKLNDFREPLVVLRKQLASNLSTPTLAKNQLGLLAWTLNSGDVAPDIKGNGSFLDPYLVPAFKGFDIPIWYNNTSKIAGLGFGRANSFEYPAENPAITIELLSRVNIIEYTLNETGKVISGVNTPSFSSEVIVAKAGGGNLLSLPNNEGSLGSLILGFEFIPKNGKLQFAPIVTLTKVVLPTLNNGEATDITWENFIEGTYSAELKEVFQNLLNKGIQLAIDLVKDKTLFQDAYNVLALMGLTQPRNPATVEGDDSYGINAAGFQALLSSPVTYMEQQVLKIFSTSEERNLLIAVLNAVFGFNIPAITPDNSIIFDFLAGLQIVGPASENYPLYPQAILEIVSNPVQELTSRFESLFKDKDRRDALAKQLTKQIDPVKFGPFQFSGKANGSVQLEIPASDPFKISYVDSKGTTQNILEISGVIALSFANTSLKVTLQGAVPLLGLALSNTFSVTYKDGGQLAVPIPEINLNWISADGKPVTKPLTILPFNSTTFLDEIAYFAPSYALNTLLNIVFESKLLDKYPTVRSIFEVLGIIEEKDNRYIMPSLLGLFEDPLGWLLSPNVLGDEQGNFSIATLASKLGDFKAASYKPTAGIDLSIAPNAAKNGIKISGLPYHFYIEMDGDPTTKIATFNFGVDTSNPVPIVGDKAFLDNLLFSVNLNDQYQPSFSGKLAVGSKPQQSNSISAVIGFDKTFDFSLVQKSNDTPFTLQFFPFQGWGKLLEETATLGAVNIINEVVPKIIAYFQSKSETEALATALSNAGNKLSVGELTTSLIRALSAGGSEQAILKKMEKSALTWLGDRFITSNAPNTITAVQTIFKAVGIGDVIKKKTDTLLTYTPSDKLPISIYFGVNENQLLGLWAGVDIPKIKYIKLSVDRAGIGVDANNLLNSDVQFSFGFDLVVPIEGKHGPALLLRFDPQKVFKLSFDPQITIPASGNALVPSDLNVEILPVFFGVNGQPPTSLEDTVKKWLFSVIKNVLPRYISVVVLNNATIASWLGYNMFEPLSPRVSTKLTPRELLVASTLVISEGEGSNKVYLLNTIDKIKDLSPATFLGNLLKELLKTTIKIIPIGKGGISIGPDADIAGNYGVTIQIVDLKIDSIPNLVLQLGGENSEWVEKSWSNASQKIDPGIKFSIPINEENGHFEIDFSKPHFSLSNIGFDIVGKNGQPIVDLTHFKLGAIQPRVYLDVKFGSGVDPTFGANLTLSEMGIALAPSQLTSGEGSNSSNPIASSLLGSSSEAQSKPKEKANPSYPTFSAEVAYVDELYVSLTSATSSGGEVVIPVQRDFGPLFVDTLGVGWDQPKSLLGLLFTGDVSLAGLKVSLIDLAVKIPVTNPTSYEDYQLGLAGLDISYKGGSVVVEAGLLKQTDPLQYTGSAVLKASTFSIMALGSYAQVPDPNAGGKKVTSLFLFGALDMPLGGVSAFFITGIAAGFGYNRSLTIPSIGEVMNFPLVAGVLNGTLTESNDPDAALTKLSTIIAPSVGEYWIAAGLKFKSFELINTAALLFVKFGNEFEIDILGLSYAALPPNLGKKDALVYFELAIKVQFKPSAGYISVEAAITPNSFVLTKECKITGGFAFYLWFKNSTKQIEGETVSIPAGDFVVTLGGYHPKFKAPKYYPKVNRLGIQWKIDADVGKVSITGGAYFAICPTAVMAGGYLKILFVAGPLKAWLDAYADFLIEWKPFYFLVEIGVTVGVSLGIKEGGVSMTLKAELGAKLNLHGPPIGGVAEVNWYVLSFKIPFGIDKPQTNDNPLGSWDTFAQNFLPPSQTPESPTVGFSSSESRRADAASTRNLGADEKIQQIVKWNIGAGLQNSGGNNEKNTADSDWVVNVAFYSFSAETVVPTNEISVNGVVVATYTSPAPIAGSNRKTGVGIRPMGYNKELKSPLSITLSYTRNGQEVDLSNHGISLNQIKNGSPSALWSRNSLNRKEAPDSKDLVVENTLTGLSINADKFSYLGDIKPFPILRLEFTPGTLKLLPYANSPKMQPTVIPSQKNPFTAIKQSIMASTVITERNAIYTALANIQPQSWADTASLSPAQQALINYKNIVNILAPLNPDLSVMATSANLILQDFPVIAPIGIYQNNGQIVPPVQVTNSRLAKKSKASKLVYDAPKLQGILRRYSAGTSVRSKLPFIRNQMNSKWLNLEAYNGKSKSVERRKIYDGGAFVWKLDAAAAHQLQLEGELSVLVACFDDFDDLLSINMVHPQEEFCIPKCAAQVAVIAHNPDDHEQVGWQQNSKLLKVNNVWAIGDGALVRVQNAQRIAVGYQRDTKGVIEASTLIDQNKVLDGKDELVNGWIKTALMTNATAIGILVEGSALTPLELSFEINGMPSSLTDKAPSYVDFLDGYCLHVYETPAGTANPENYLGLIVHDQNSQIAGIYSMANIDEKADGVLKSLELCNAALDVTADKINTARISLAMSH